MKYYVYRHIRLDTNTPFYVGKGKGKRAYSKNSRNSYWHNIVNKVGYKIEIIIDNLSEEEVFIKEMDLIKLYKSLGYCEANITDGGEGLSGFKHTEATKEKMSKKHLGKKLNKETIELIKSSLKGHTHSEKTKNNISLKVSGKNNGFYGKQHSKKTKNNISLKLSGKNNPNFGKKGKASPHYGKNHSEETKKKMSISHIGKSHTLESRIKMSKKHGGSQFEVYKGGKLIGKWQLISQCAQDLGLTGSKISMCLNGHRVSHKGYTFKKLEN